MSGDVQPRKRKDKRRKKEEVTLGKIHDLGPFHQFKMENKKKIDLSYKGEKIHVQSKYEIGGNACVKVIFFCLLGLLLVAVGLIYLQSQGSTDVDLPSIEDSRFSEYFTGWLDDSKDNHEQESSEDVNQNKQKDKDEENYSQESEEDENSELDRMSRLFSHRTNEENEDVKKGIVNSNRAEESIEQDSYNQEDEDEDINESENEEDEEESGNENEDEDENNADEEEKLNKAEEVEDEEEEEEKEINNNDVESNEQEEENEEEENDASQLDDDYHKTEIFKKKIIIKRMIDLKKIKYNKNKQLTDFQKEEDNSNVDEKSEVKDVKDEWTEGNDDLGYEEIDESEEDNFEESDSMKEETSEGYKKFAKEETFKLYQKEKYGNLEQDESEMNNEEEEIDNELGGVTVKLVVGIALIIVAHLVLFQKWKARSNACPDETGPNEGIKMLYSDCEPIISRRQTLVVEKISLDRKSVEEESPDWSEEEEFFGKGKLIGEELKIFDEENLNDVEKRYDNVSEETSADDESKYEEDGDELEEIQDAYEYEEEEVEVEDEEEEVEDEDEEEEVEDEDEGEEVEDEYGEKNSPNYGEEEDVEEEEDGDDDEYDFDLKPNNLTREEDSPPTPPPRIRKRDEQSIGNDFGREGTDSNGEETGNESEPDKSKHASKKVGDEEESSFRQEYDYADEQFENNPNVALSIYERILSKKPSELRALVGRAKVLDHLAELKMSNAYLKQATNAYSIVLLQYGNRLDDETYEKLAERCILRMRFGGHLVAATEIHKALINRFPDTPKHRNDLSVTYLMLNKIEFARKLLKETLSLWPGNGFALVHYGFILKTTDNNMEEGAKLLMEGIQTKEEGVIDGMFFFHLGDALNRLGRPEEATKWYDFGVKEGLFLSRYQRSLYNINRLKGQPWWTKEETTYEDFFNRLESNWKEIRREGLELLNSKGVNLFKEESENLKDTGDWRQLDLFFRGRKQGNCQKAPVTCSLVSSFKPAADCTRGQIKFSVMMPKTHVWPHCGPTNCRLRSHLGLVVPEKTYIRVAEETRTWEEGKLFVFDDSFEHEVWHNGTGLRLVLIVDVWHPEVTQNERKSLSPI